MKKNNWIFLCGYFIIHILLTTSVGAIYTSPVKQTCSRGENYTFEVTTTSSFSYYEVTLNSEAITFIDMHNATTIKVQYVIPEIVETKMIYQFLVITYDSQRYQIENITFEFIIAANLTDEELWAMWEKYRQVAEEKEAIDDEYEAWKHNYTGLPVEENAWDKYGAGFTTACTVAGFMVSFVFTPIFIPAMYVFKKKQKKAEAKEKKEAEERHKMERNMKMSDLYMNPQVEEDDGKRKRYHDLLNEYEYICVKKLNRELDLSFFLRIQEEEIYDKSTKTTRAKTSLDVLKEKIEKDEYTRDNPLRKKHIIVAVIKNLNYRKWSNGTSNDARERHPFPINCNKEDIVKYAMKIHEEKEAWLSGAGGKEAMEYEKMNKDLYDDYEEIKITAHTDKKTGEKVFDAQYFVKDVRSQL